MKRRSPGVKVDIAGRHGKSVGVNGQGGRRTLERTAGPGLPDYDRNRGDLAEERREQEDQDLFRLSVHRIYA